MTQSEEPVMIAEEPVIIDGQEIHSRDEALTRIAQGPGFMSLVPDHAPEEAKKNVLAYAENLWQLGNLLDNGGKFVITPEGVNRAVSICDEGAEHADYAWTQSDQVKSFLSAMCGSCEEGRVLASKVSQWMDDMCHRATTYQAILSGVSEGTLEIKNRAEESDSEWAHSFHVMQSHLEQPSLVSQSVGARVDQ